MKPPSKHQILKKRIDKLEITEILDFYVQGFKMKPDPWKLIIVTDEKDRVCNRK